MNRYTIPNLFKFKSKRKISAALSSVKHRNGKGYALIVGDNIVDAGKIVVDDIKFISCENKGKFFAEKNDGTLVLADFYSGACNEIIIEKNPDEVETYKNYAGYKIPEGYLIHDRENDLKYIIYAEKENGQYTSKSFISEAYKFIAGTNSETGLRKVIPDRLHDNGFLIFENNKDNIYYYIDEYGKRKSDYIKSESNIDENGNKTVLCFDDGDEKFRYYLTNKAYEQISFGYDKILPIADKYVGTRYSEKKNNLNIVAKVEENVLLDKKGDRLTANFGKYYALANGDFLIRPEGMNNFKLIDGISFKVKESDIKNPIVCEKLDIFFAKQKGVATIFGDNSKTRGEIDPIVAIAVMNKLNGKKIPASAIDYIIENQIDIEPTLDAFAIQLNANRMMRSEDPAMQHACERSLKEVRNALYNSSANRIKKYNKQIKDINQTTALTERFKIALGNSKYSRRRKVTKQNQANSNNSVKQMEIDLSEVDGFKQLEINLSEDEQGKK